MEKIFVFYLILVNLISFIIFAVDKVKAKKSKWRIPEKTLFILAIIGGSAGALAGMYIFRHKTKKTAFKFGIPLILIIQVALIFFIITR